MNAPDTDAGAKQQFGDLLRLAAAGDPDALNNLGVLLVNGIGVPRIPAMAKSLFSRAAIQGHGIAQYNLALRFLRGDGAQRNLPLALMWLRSAASAGYPPALNDLGAAYLSGDGVTPDFLEAVRLFVEAASAGDVKAISNLSGASTQLLAMAMNGDVRAQLLWGHMKLTGVGVPQDEMIGRKWLETGAGLIESVRPCTGQLDFI